ncbi:MAG: molybdenum cofactor guanylyltransferase, partial [Capsulimonadaceae bacterium]
MNEASPLDIVVAILAGGQSRRMGHDKLALKLDGRTLLDRTIDAALGTGHRVVVVGRHGTEEQTANVTFIDDDVLGAGPLAGLVAALAFARPAAVVALAADLPYLDAGGIEWLIEAARGALASDGLAVRNNGLLEPLFSVYTQQTAERAGQRLGEGRRSLHGLVEEGAFQTLVAPDWIAAQLYNVNEPADWDRVVSTAEFVLICSENRTFHTDSTS